MLIWACYSWGFLTSLRCMHLLSFVVENYVSVGSAPYCPYPFRKWTFFVMTITSITSISKKIGCYIFILWGFQRIWSLVQSRFCLIWFISLLNGTDRNITFPTVVVLKIEKCSRESKNECNVSLLCMVKEGKTEESGWLCKSSSISPLPSQIKTRRRQQWP